MTTIYLPIEISKREIVSKVFLATRLALLGHRVYIFRFDIFDRIGWPEKGIYIGKNCFRTEVPYSLEYYNKMKKSGIQIWHLDEEGGIYAGDDEKTWKRRLLHRLDPKTLSMEDILLTWGEWQKEAFTAKNRNLEIYISGSPNYDLFQPKYKQFLQDFDDLQTEGIENFILINTRFSLANGVYELEQHLTRESPISDGMRKSEIIETAISHSRYLFEFIRLVRELSLAFPDRNIVLRPHPAEKSSTYTKYFTDLKNVFIKHEGDVGSWIRKSSLLIHNGCSTAIQASIAEKPVINYQPFNEHLHLSPGLPNRVGKTAKTVDEIINFIKNEAWNISTSEFNRTITNIDSIEYIAEMVNKHSSTYQHREQVVNVSMYQSLFDLLECVRSTVRKFFPEKLRKFEIRESLFDSNFFKKIPILHKCADDYYKSHTRLQRISKNVYVLNGQINK
jgi:surface carbohydrate biosynthesis protein